MAEQSVLRGDLTSGSVTRRLLGMAAPIAVGMVFQTLYFLIDLYFVSQLGDHAIAGVGGAGNLTFVVLGLTQILAVGTVAPVAQAIGRRDIADANLIFNQSMAIAALMAGATLVVGYLAAGHYMHMVAADEETALAGSTYLRWYLPGLALQFAITVMSSGLRGTGIVRPAIAVQMLSVTINAALAPVLIAGWGTGHALGVAGAGLSSSIAVAIGTVLLWLTFRRVEHAVTIDPNIMKPRRETWRRIFAIGLPAGAEFLLMFVYLAVIYLVIGRFGAQSQAGFGIGQRVMQSMFLPIMAIGFAAAPVAGQNFGAGRHDRVRATFRAAALISGALMLTMTLFCQWRPEALIRIFTTEPPVVAVGAEFLAIIAWNFVPSGLVSTCSGIFQGLGNTWPPLQSSMMRMATFAIPALLLSRLEGFEIRHVWYLSALSVLLQAGISLALLQREFRRKLAPP